jgi:hypothetical protein
VAKAFFDLYRTQNQEFPPECRDGDYEKQLKAAYPIHPEVFDRLYNGEMLTRRWMPEFLRLSLGCLCRLKATQELWLSGRRCDFQVGTPLPFVHQRN